MPNYGSSNEISFGHTGDISYIEHIWRWAKPQSHMLSVTEYGRPDEELGERQHTSIDIFPNGAEVHIEHDQFDGWSTINFWQDARRVTLYLTDEQLDELRTLIGGGA